MAAWRPPVLTCSALEGTGLDDVWQQVLDHRAALDAAGAFAEHRRRQQIDWMWTLVHERLRAAIQHDPRLRPTLSQHEADVAAGRLAPSAAARRVLADFTAKDSP